MATAEVTTITDEEFVLAYLKAGRVIASRLRETSLGDVHDMVGVPLEIRDAGIEERVLVRMLEDLHKRHLVCKVESVCAYDSSEYTVIWRAE